MHDQNHIKIVVTHFKRR